MLRPPIWCSDCGARMEEWGLAWRCPWAKTAMTQARQLAGGHYECRRPYTGDHKPEIAGTGRRTTR